jgi:hypothetical protein
MEESPDEGVTHVNVTLTMHPTMWLGKTEIATDNPEAHPLNGKAGRFDRAA